MGENPGANPVGARAVISGSLAQNQRLHTMNTRFSLGIDLGTSNSVIAIADLQTDQAEVVKVTQILGPNQVGEKMTLPSALYVPHHDEFAEDSFPMPWESGAGSPTII